MINERKKAILTLIGAVVIGILLGLLIPGLFHKVRDGKYRGHEDRNKTDVNKKEWFTKTIYRIVQPDSNQLRQIKPITEWAALRIDSLEASSNRQLASVLDSVKQQLKPMITAEQYKRLDEFEGRAKGHWRGKGRN